MALIHNDYDFYYLSFLGFSTLTILTLIMYDIIKIKDVDIMNETFHY